MSYYPSKKKYHFDFNFLRMNAYLEIFHEEHYYILSPKYQLLKMWGNVILIYLLLLTCAYSILIVAVFPFMFAYSTCFYHLWRVWKEYGYSRSVFLIGTLLGLILCLFLSTFLREMLIELIYKLI